MLHVSNFFNLVGKDAIENEPGPGNTHATLQEAGKNTIGIVDGVIRNFT